MIFDPGICFEPFGDLPLSLRAGFQVGFLSDMTYYQEERLIEPQNVYYENGERVRGQFSGNIPNAESQYFALSLGARYRATNFGNFALFPSLRFNYGLTNLVNGIDWKVSTLQAGISLVYNFPKAEYPKPAPPPMPPLPVPAEPLPPAQLDIFVNIELNGKNAKEFDIPFTVYESKSEYYLLPYIFFKENSDLIYTEKSQSSQNISEATAQSNVLKAAALILKEHPDYSVTLLSNSLDSESDEIVNNRITKISNELISYGIDISHIKISKHKVKVKQEEIPELKAEQIYIKLNIPEYQDLIPYTLTYSVKMEFSGRNILHIIPDIKTSVKLKAFEGKMYRNKNIIKRFDENGAEININTEAPFVIEDELRPIEFTVDLFAKNEGGAKTTLTEKIKLIPQEERRYVEKNIINKNNKTYSRYILCYFDFDGTNSVIVNKDVLTIIEQAIAEDKEIKLIPLSDNIGTAEYNKELVEKRARAAMRLLSGFDGKFNTEYFDGFLFPNDTPTGRMLNRTVIVMIAD
jgi:outer membrane protein OmpA-like peptidoglycan-associated protein